MLYLRLRFFLISLFLVVGIILLLKIGWWPSLAPFTAAFVLILSYLFLGTVGPAFTALKKGQLPKAEKLINLTPFPEFLLKRHRAYYHFTKGMLDLQSNQLQTGESHFKTALELGLRNSNDKGFAALNLAHINYVNRNFDQSREYLDKCKSFNPDDLLIEEKMGELEKAILANS